MIKLHIILFEVEHFFKCNVINDQTCAYNNYYELLLSRKKASNTNRLQTRILILKKYLCLVNLFFHVFYLFVVVLNLVLKIFLDNLLKVIPKSYLNHTANQVYFIK
jgi:hypothetical protein